MGLTLSTTLDISDRGMFERASTALRNPRELLLQVGVLGMGSAVRRLRHVLKQDDEGVRSGALMSSIQAGLSGEGGGDTVFELTNTSVEVGTNVSYAKQVQDPVPILPAEQKALAIPLTKELKLAKLWPRDLDPNRELLQFVPYTGSKPNVIGLLIDPGEVAGGKGQKGKRGGGKGKTPYGPGVLFALAYYVVQQPRPFLFWDDQDLSTINEKLIPAWLGSS